MENQYSLVHLTHGACPPPKLIYLAARTGYDYVSLRGIPARSDAFPAAMTGAAPFDLLANSQMRREIKTAVRDTGVRVFDIENARLFDGVAVNSYERDLECAAELGVTKILTNIWTTDLSEGIEKFQQLCELAASFGQCVHLEFVTWSTIKTLNDAASVVSKACQNNGRIILDTLHFYRSRVQLSDLDHIPAGLIEYIHLCDCPAEIPDSIDELAKTGTTSRLIPGKGAIDIRAIVQKLPNAVRGLEVPNPAPMKALGPEGYLKRLLICTKKLLEGI